MPKGKQKQPLTFGQAVFRFVIAMIITFVIVFACGVGMYHFTEKYSKPVPGRSPSADNQRGEGR